MEQHYSYEYENLNFALKGCKDMKTEQLKKYHE